MAKRRKNGGSVGSLDSLLDTMTNVVGILVILLVVTQLGVRDAVDRITSDKQVSPEDLAAAKAEARSAESERVALETRLQQERLALERQVKAVTSGNLQEQLDILGGQIRMNRDEIARLQKKLTEEEQKHQQIIEDAEELAKQFEEREKKLTEQLTAAEEQISKLKALLDDTPLREAPPAKVVHLPNPRPAPEGATPLQFVCREGKIYYWNREEMRKTAQQRAELMVRQRGLGSDPKVGVEAVKLIGPFNSVRPIINDDWFMVQLAADGRIPRVVFERKRNGGETLADLANPRSQFRRGLQTVDPNKHYLRFTVWPDSFDVYLEARSIAAERGLAAGWDMSSATGELSIPLGGSLRLGPEPPPNPNPKPNDPPKPQPDREVPVDTID